MPLKRLRPLALALAVTILFVIARAPSPSRKSSASAHAITRTLPSVFGTPSTFRSSLAPKAILHQIVRYPSRLTFKRSLPLTDATSVNTAHWACIGWNESRNIYTLPGGRWQFEGPTWHSITGLSSLPEASSPSVQDAAALSLYRYDMKLWGNGFHAWSTRWLCGLG